MWRILTNYNISINASQAKIVYFLGFFEKKIYKRCEGDITPVGAGVSMGKNHVTVVKMSKKTAQIVEKCYKCVNFEVKRAPCVKILKNITIFKCSPN